MVGRKVEGDVPFLEKHPFLPLCIIRRGEARSQASSTFHPSHSHSLTVTRDDVAYPLYAPTSQQGPAFSPHRRAHTPSLSSHVTTTAPSHPTSWPLGLTARRLAHRTTVHRPITARLLACAAEPPRTRYHAWQNRAVPRAPRRTMRCEHDTPHAPRASPRRTSGRRRTD